jgi:hypothetical protein
MDKEMNQIKITILTYFPHDIQKAQRRIEFAMSSVKLPLEIAQSLNSVIEILNKGRVITKERNNGMVKSELGRVNGGSPVGSKVG